MSHVAMILPWIQWAKQNLFLKLILPFIFIFSNITIAKFLNTYIAYVFFWTTLSQALSLEPW